MCTVRVRAKGAPVVSDGSHERVLVVALHKHVEEGGALAVQRDVRVVSEQHRDHLCVPLERAHVQRRVLWTQE